MTGTNTLRWSSSNPNSQNISKKESFNLRRCFGPAPGREWWSLDYQNLELRIPAFEAGEDELIEVFLHPERPPYFGSYHLAVFDTLHPELFARHGKAVKTLFEATWYQWVKNGNFATLYGAQEAKADATYRVPGAFRRIQGRFRKMAALSDRMKAQADRLGFVETIPDRSVDPARGYPILTARTEWGRVLPTTPLNYHIQSTAMWCTARAMVRCQERLDEWRAGDGFDGHMVLQVHDELVTDFPFSENMGNLWRVKEIARLMEMSGEGIGVPTPVTVEYNPVNWADGVPV